LPTPEEEARQEIDRRLEECGWLIQDHKAMNIMAGLGVAVREFPLKSGFADYLLYANGKAIGIVEAKPEGHTLTGVEVQSSKYTFGLPDGIPVYCKPLPFAYESTGTVTQFRTTRTRRRSPTASTSATTSTASARRSRRPALR
jgi:type I restriction enzyme, R subunit